MHSSSLWNKLDQLKGNMLKHHSDCRIYWRLGTDGKFRSSAKESEDAKQSEGSGTWTGCNCSVSSGLAWAAWAWAALYHTHKAIKAFIICRNINSCMYSLQKVTLTAHVAFIIFFVQHPQGQVWAQGHFRAENWTFITIYFCVANVVLLQGIAGFCVVTRFAATASQ